MKGPVQDKGTTPHTSRCRGRTRLERVTHSCQVTWELGALTFTQQRMNSSGFDEGAGRRDRGWGGNSSLQV